MPRRTRPLTYSTRNPNVLVHTGTVNLLYRKSTVIVHVLGLLLHFNNFLF